MRPVYQEIVAGGALSSVVRCVWERDGAPVDRQILVLPDGCVDIVWRSDGAFFVAGPDLGPVVHPHPSSTEFVGLRLEPGAAATVLGVGVDELRDRRVPMVELWGSAAESLASRLDATTSAHERRGLLARSVLTQIGDGPLASLDDRVLAATRMLGSEPARVSEIAESVGLSDRQLHRRFVHQVGYGPATFVRVMRFSRFLDLGRTEMRRQGRSGLAALAAAAGYADQAHLTRECRRLAGRTPREILTAA